MRSFILWEKQTVVLDNKWTYNGSQIQNPVEQKLLVQCTEDGTEEIKKAANNAPYALKVTLEKMNLAAPAKLTLNLKEEWNADKFSIVWKRMERFINWILRRSLPGKVAKRK